MDRAKELPDWEAVYRSQPAETLHWFYPELDPDLAAALARLGIFAGSFLDIGSGPGTQTLALAERGFDVTGVDVSEAAVRAAGLRAAQKDMPVAFLQDDIVSTRLRRSFDYISDRGCFHALEPDQREKYARVVDGLLRDGGRFFLKCFSYKQPGVDGPYRFWPQQIQEIFFPFFIVESIAETVFQGTLDPFPLALFVTLRKK